MIFSLRWTGAMLLLVAIDQLTKWAASTYLSFFNSVESLPPVLSFQLVHNYGAAYGVFQNKTVFLIGVSTLVIALVVWFQKTLGTTWMSRLGVVCLVAGALGNLLDRIRVGYVIDFINIHILPVFNVADMCINAGVVCFLIELVVASKFASPRSKE